MTQGLVPCAFTWRHLVSRKQYGLHYDPQQWGCCDLLMNAKTNVNFNEKLVELKKQGWFLAGPPEAPASTIKSRIDF